MAQGAAPQRDAAAKPEMTENCPGLVAERRRSAAGAPRRAQRRSGAHQLHRPLDLPDREPAAGAHRHRLQRLCAAAGAARHRHDESRALDALHRPPDPAIKHVLRGWAGDEKPARIDLQIQGRARAQRADQYPRLDGGGTERHGNSIFIFEIASLCIAHLGHLHHTLNAAAAQRDRPRRHRAGAGRRQLHAGHGRHGRGAARR